MNPFGLFGSDDSPPPAAEATFEDIAEYQREFLQRNPVEASSGTEKGSGALQLGKAATIDGTRYRAEFPWLFGRERGVRWDFNPIETRTLAQRDTWVEMLVETIVKEIAETSWTITEADDRRETDKRLQTHPEEREPLAKDLPDRRAEQIYDSLANPNPDDTWHDMVQMWMADLLEVGSIAAIKAFPADQYDDNDELIRDPETMRPRALMTSAPEVWTKDFNGKTGLLDGFWQFEQHTSPGGPANAHTGGGFTPTRFDSGEVAWNDMSPRSNRRYGLPPTLLVQRFVKATDLAISQEQEYLSRGSIASGALNFPDWDKQRMEEWKTENEENIKGKPWKMLMFAGTEMEHMPFSYNFEEMQFTERMQWYARVIASAFQVPTAVVGIEPEKVNYNTFQGERSNFESNTLGPYLQELERFINDKYVGMHWSGYRFEFTPGLSESTRGMISERVRSEFNAGIITRDEARREIGRGSVEDLDIDAEDGFSDDVTEDGSGGPFDDLEMSLSKGDPTRENHEVDPGSGVGLCENTGKEFECETMADLAGDCPHCGDPISYIDPEDLDKGAKGFSADVFRIVADGENEMFDAGAVLGIGVDFPNSDVYVDWKVDAWPDDEKLSGGHVSIYSTIEDAQQVAQGTIEPMDTLDAEAQAEVAASVVKSVRKDEALRNTEEWAQFDVQPGEVQALQEEIAAEIDDLFDAVLSDEQVQQIIERLAADETEKSSTELSRRLKELLRDSALAEGIAAAIQDGSASAAREALDSAVSETDADVDVDVQAITEQLQDRDIGFANRFADDLAAEIRETVADGWEAGMNTREIQSEIAELGDIEEGWTGAEKIARQELQIATGRARSEFAAEAGKVEVWETSGDGRVRDAHQEMQGRWKRPGEEWVVEYDDRGVQKESVPGDSEPGIGCRCQVLLADREDVDDDDHAGSGSLN